MSRFFAIVLISIFLFSCNSEKQLTGFNQLSSDEKRGGWKLLFDGKSTKGWHKYGNKPVGAAWKILDNNLCLDTMNKDGGDIVIDEEYENFHLQLEWKISKNGNSGIIFYIHEDKTKYNWPWETGMEMQVLDNDGHPDAKFQKHRAGDLYDLIACSKETVKPVVEWNLVEINA